jgi:hypothetical protein
LLGAAAERGYAMAAPGIALHWSPEESIEQERAA